MKSALLILLILSNSSLQPIFAQQTITSPATLNQGFAPPKSCFTDQKLQEKIASDPNYALRVIQMNQQILANQGNAARQTQTIPVVVHVIHNNGVENISDSQILNGIQHLNDAFANSGNFSDPNGVNVNIQFCLAQQNPNGFITNGITRTVSSLTNMTAETQDADLKNLIRWNPNRYLNIWLVKEITSLSMGSGIAGYAYFPSSQGQPEDGIVNEAGLFGSSVDNSKVHIHEAGHYLGLYHTFEGACINNNCQTDGDHVCDTPPDQSTAAVNCTASPNTCTTDSNDPSINNPFRTVAFGGIGDQPDQFKNYMDYGFQACQEYFSGGQAQRMVAALNEQRAILLVSNGCVSPCFNPISVNITSNNPSIIAGETVTFSSNTGIGALLEWKINDQIVGNQVDLIYEFSNPGIYTLMLTATNDSPNCFATQTLIVQVQCPAQANFSLNDAAEINPGDAVSTTNLSSNNTTNQWMLNGQPSTNGVNWSQTFLISGSHALYLIVGNGVCFDTSATKFFQVGSCNYSRVTDNWVFLNGGMRFYDDGNIGVFAPPPINNINNECSSSISDADGNLLFFSDGNTIWNAGYITMPNGDSLLGCQSSTQAVLITPSPGNPNQFYVFTSDCVENNLSNGIRYSLVDMSLNGGTGDVVPNYKNIKILDFGSEKLSATWHANGRDVWVGTNQTGTNDWYAFLIDDNGINTQPVVSSIGARSQQALAAMRFSNDGNRMAACMISDWPWRILVCDFNKETGIYSNPIEIILSAEFNQQPFSIAFSPDNSKLYVSFWQGNDLIQYDLSNTTAIGIQNSRYVVDSYESAIFGHLVLASNGKIYVNAYSGYGLDEIRQPNLLGAACDYYSATIGTYPYFQNLGSSLPNMLQGYLSASNPVIAGPQSICKGGVTYNYGIVFPSSEDSTIWQHTGPGIFSAQNGQNTCTLSSSNNTGSDVIIATVYGRCGITRDTIQIQTNNPETTNLPEQIIGCDTYWLNPGDDFIYYLWQDGSHQNPYFIDTTGIYYVTVKGASSCMITDSTLYLPFPEINNLSLGPDISTCQNQAVVLQPTQEYDYYTWQDGSHNETFTAFLPGQYWLTVPSGCSNEVTDTVRIIETILDLNLNLNGLNRVCKTALPLTINAPSDYISYLWSTGATTQNLPINSIGSYSLIAFDETGCEARDTFFVVDCLSIENQIPENEFSIFPNPSQYEIQVNFPFLNLAHLQIFNSLGQLCFSKTITNSKQSNITIHDWAKGTYLLRLTSEKLNQNRIFIKN